jgi:hypothetical protein
VVAVDDVFDVGDEVSSSVVVLDGRGVDFCVEICCCICVMGASGSLWATSTHRFGIEKIFPWTRRLAM